MMLKATHASEDQEAAVEKANGVIQKLQETKPGEAAEKIKCSVLETVTNCELPGAYWKGIRTNNPLERLLREVRRSTRVVGLSLAASER